MKSNFLDDTIAVIYETVDDTSRWESVIDLIIEHLQFDAGAFSFENPISSAPDSRYSISLVDSPEKLSSDDYYQHDYLKKISLTDLKDNNAHLNQNASPQPSHLTPIIHNELDVPTSICQWLGGNIQIRDSVSACLTLYRSRKLSAFDAPASTAINQLLPHIWRAVRLRSKLNISETQTKLQDELLSYLNVCALIVNEDLKILNATDTFYHLLESGNLKTVKVNKDRIVLSNDQAQRTLIEITKQNDHLQDYAKPDDGPRKKNVYRDHDIEIDALPYKLGKHNLFHLAENTRFTILFIRPKLDFSENRIHDCCEQLGITHTEFTICQALSRGMTVSEFAEQQHKSEHTVRTQIKILFKKLDVSNQAGLVGAFLSAIQNS